MTERKSIYYATAGLLAIIIFASNFLSTDIFTAGYQNFSVWFVLSVFSFACGWLLNKTLGYAHGGKVIFAVIVASAFITVLLISFFSDYFGLSDLLVENMILYILRNITLGSIGFFGMVVCELIQLQKDTETNRNKTEEIRRLIANAQHEANLIIEDARIKADRMLYDTQNAVEDMLERKTQIEFRLKEFIAAERELIKKYESEED